MKTEPIQCGTQGFAEQMVMKIKLSGICDKLTDFSACGYCPNIPTPDRHIFNNSTKQQIKKRALPELMEGQFLTICFCDTFDSELSFNSVLTLFYSAIAADQCCPILGQAKACEENVGNESRCRPNAVAHVTSIPLAGAASELADRSCAACTTELRAQGLRQSLRCRG